MITIYIIKIFSDSFSLGVFTSVFGIISSLIGIAFAKFLKKKHYSSLIMVSAIATILSFLAMVLSCNAFTIIIFNFCQTIYKCIIHAINEVHSGNLCNDPRIRRNYKTEYRVIAERYYAAGRTVSAILFLLTAFFSDITPIMFIFAFAMAAFALSSLRLHRSITKKSLLPKNTQSPNRDRAYAIRRLS